MENETGTTAIAGCATAPLHSCLFSEQATWTRPGLGETGFCAPSPAILASYSSCMALGASTG